MPTKKQPESILSLISVKYGGEMDSATKEFLEQKIAEQKFTTDTQAEFVEAKRKAKEKPLTPRQVKTRKIKAEKQKLIDDKTPMREGRRIAVRQRRYKAVLIRLTPEQHDTIRRVAGHFQCSLAETFRDLATQKEAELWPDKSTRPNIIELDMADRKKKEELIESTHNWTQRRRNAIQRKEAKYRQELQRVEERQREIDVRKQKAEIKLREMEEIRAERVAGSEKMYSLLAEERFVAREMAKETIVDVECALQSYQAKVGRKLTETEKSEIGNRVRAMKGGKQDLELEKVIAGVIAKAESLANRKLTVKERWKIRRETRAKSRE